MKADHDTGVIQDNTLRTLVKAARGPFLVLTPACVFLGLALVIRHKVDVDWLLFLLVASGAILAHIAVNTLNEYQDFRSGLDLITRRTAFSGGSGALPSNPAMAGSVWSAAILSVLIMIAIGIALIWKTGLGILPVGILGIVLIIAYTRWINKNPYLCLIAPGLGFGLLMVLGTERVLAGGFSNQGLLAATVPFLLVNNLLLLNQYPDIDADKAVGRNHLPIAFGVQASNWVYLFTAILAVSVIVTGSLAGNFPLLSSVSAIAVLPAFFVFSGAVKLGQHIGKEPKYLAANVIVAVLTPVLLGISLLVA